jgi:hypothetical protein
MTDEVGAITGDLEVETHIESGSLAVRVRYAGAGEWYTVTGSPVLPEEPGAELHERVVEHLTTPGPVVGGNEEAVSLQGMDLS